MSATGHQQRRRMAAADEIAGGLVGRQVAEFIERAGLGCAPDREALRECLVVQGDYNAMLRTYREVAEQTPTNGADRSDEPASNWTGPPHEPPVTEDGDDAPGETVSRETSFSNDADDAIAAALAAPTEPTPKPKPKRKRKAAPRRAKKETE